MEKAYNKLVRDKIPEIIENNGEKPFIKILTEEDAYNKGINTALEKVNLTLSDNEGILLKKVLKKEVNDSTIYLEIFIVTKENIGMLQVVEEEIKNGVESNS